MTAKPKGDEVQTHIYEIPARRRGAEFLRATVFVKEGVATCVIQDLPLAKP